MARRASTSSSNTREHCYMRPVDAGAFTDRWIHAMAWLLENNLAMP